MLLILPAMLPASAATASSAQPESTAANPASADADFQLQGEFMGVMHTARGQQPLGIQVVAQGKGQFSARGYVGGLPGNGWDQQDTLEWAGKRDQNVVTLQGTAGRLLVDYVGATLTSDDGGQLAQLERVARQSGSLGQPPPPDAVVLFNGTDTSAFEKAEITPDGWLLAGATTKQPFGDFRLHLEFKTPYMPAARGQGRGNSGVYIQQRYEVQVLDSFGLPPVVNGCGALYKQKEPRINMSLPPLSWQTYDIDFQAARWDARGNKIRNARITVLHNGIRIHNDYALVGKTGAGKPESPDDRPLRLQFHGNPVHFRNVWLIPYERPTFESTSAPDCLRRCLPGPLRGRRLFPWRADRINRF